MLIRRGSMPLRSLQALCLVNFFMADVRDGLGPFLGIFLTEHQWKADNIGWMMTAGGLAGLVATMPSGLVADASRHKRGLLVVCCLLITTATLLLWAYPTLFVVGFSQFVTGVSAAFIAPLLMGITLGLTGSSGFNHQMGRNEAFNHGGNMSAAILAAILVLYLGTDAVFILMTGMAICATLAVFAIRNNDIDNRAARGLSRDEDPAAVPRLSAIITHPALIATGVTLMLFHLANAALLPMLSMRVAAAPGGEMSAGVYAAATVIISQLVMIPVALFAAARAGKYGYPWLITAALMVLPLRAALACVSAGPLFMIPVQILDGVAAGLLGVAVPGYIVKLLEGSGHTNAGQSFIMLLQGVGAAFSPAMAGTIAAKYSYGVAFAVLGAIALLALLIWWLRRLFSADRTARQYD
ncbi:MFS transporter [Kosakonia quasisacchari]|uniref:MFS transporter n=2 Tax=Kosakonia quasisacchari TaxID=2529380 RepID=A0A4V2LZQ5_9ENTR|nr:MFS transporter [Kosakonia quasisacchari]